jgi:hypothetical protein
MMKGCKYAVVGVEDMSNLRLAQILRRLHGKENVARFLELSQLGPFLAANSEYPIVVCLDLFGFDLAEATGTIERVRETCPRVVFNLYLDKDVYRARTAELPASWHDRLSHYYKTYKESADIEYEPIVRASLRGSEREAMHNLTNEPIRLTPVFQKGLILPESSETGEPSAPIAFLSYSRKDWEGFVSTLARDLAKESKKVWIDQDYIIGGDDWMDAIGEALQTCDTLLLVLSPDSISSKYVKMEYRYFFRQDKPIIPILYQHVARMPFELATLHYVDFTKGDQAKSYQELLRVLSRQRNRAAQ